MEIVRNKHSLIQAIRALRDQGKTIGFVPTMGALHAGHISLVRIARLEADYAVTSIFINPTQFAAGEDFAKYPRTEEDDLEKLEEAGVAIAYLPTAEEMYPPCSITKVQVPGISNEMEGAIRPGHFDGVATIVTKLFLQVAPDIAVFGEKDFQQLHIIRQFTRDLDIPVRIVGGPTLRESDGLAMSSRNRYLNTNERAIAASLYRVLSETADKIIKDDNPADLLAEAKQSILAAGFAQVDYVELRDAATLSSVTKINQTARLLAAARLGTTRLIDNIEISK